MSKNISLPKGTKDCLPSDSYIWEYLESFLRNKADIFGIKEIRTPIFEHTELFLRGVGNTTDIVQKEMYTFQDKGNRSITLKAEGTAPTIRAFIEHSLYAQTQPTKLFYITPVFRYENVQKGRLRQHHQFGVEIFGSEFPVCDADIINIAYSIYYDLGIRDISVKINSLGCQSCRPKYNEILKLFLNENKQELCGLCNDRLEKNPLRILDCKDIKCKTIIKNAPSILDYICNDCSVHFKSVQEYLELLNIEFLVDTNIVRGLDYYTRTVFEIVNNDGIALCGGGRYDNLVQQLGDKDVPAIGFGMGIERLILALDEKEISVCEDKNLDLFLIPMDDTTKNVVFDMCNKLRKKGIKSDVDYLQRSLKAQMKYANKLGVRNVIVVGQDEINNKYLNIKNMKDGTNFKCDFSVESIVNYIRT